MTVDDSKNFRHRFCVSRVLMRPEYARSPGYQIVDENGSPDPNGWWVRKPSGKFIKIEGQCDHPEEECLAHTVKNPDTHIIPPVTEERVVEPDDILDKLEKLIAAQSRNKA